MLDFKATASNWSKPVYDKNADQISDFDNIWFMATFMEIMKNGWL